MRVTSTGQKIYTEADGLPGSVVLALYADRRGDLSVSAERGVARFSRERFSPLLVAPGSRMQRISASRARAIRCGSATSTSGYFVAG